MINTKPYVLQLLHWQHSQQQVHMHLSHCWNKHYDAATPQLYTCLQTCLPFRYDACSRRCRNSSELA
jgi:hypothetical protein